MKLSTSNVGSLRSNKRFLAVSVLAAICLMLTFFSMGPSLSTCHGTIRTVNSAQALSSDGSKQMTFANLNHLTATASARDNKEHVLILTPLKNAVPYLERYFELVDRLSYPKHLISLAFLVSDTTDSTVSELQRHARELQSRWQDRYHSIRIFEKDFKFATQTSFVHGQITQLPSNSCFDRGNLLGPLVGC
jgi:cellulose synthase/poly-beta-1,6-N-acetylglucosamine synthase-like glycosyltransferase